MKKKNQYLYIDLCTNRSKWMTKKDFLFYTVGDEYDGCDSRGYYMSYKLDDGTIEKEYYNWKENFEIRKTPTHTIYKGEEVMLIDFTNHKFSGAKLQEV
jgi:hypothetical protein